MPWGPIDHHHYRSCPYRRFLALAYYAFMLFAWGVFIQDEGETKNHKTMRDYAFMLFAWGVFIQYQGETKNHKTMRDYASMLFTLGVFI